MEKDTLRNGYLRIADKLQGEDLHGAMAVARNLGLMGIMNEIGEIMYSPNEVYNTYRQRLIEYLIEE